MNQPQWRPQWRPHWRRPNRAKSERFARALDEHQRYAAEGEETDEFAEELAVVSALRTLDSEGAAPSSRERIRNRIADGTTRSGADTPRASTPRENTHRRTGPHVGNRNRFAMAAATAVCIGLAALTSQFAEDSLPGDMLYDVKRTAEALSVEVSFSEDARAAKHLELASTRVSELEALAAGHDTPRSHRTEGAPLYGPALEDLGDSATQAARVVTTTATRSGGEALQSLGSWAAEHTQRVRALSDRTGEDVDDEIRASAELLAGIEARANALSARMDCYQITSGSTDQLGALPADKDCHDHSASYASQRWSTAEPIDGEREARAGGPG